MAGNDVINVGMRKTGGAKRKRKTVVKEHEQLYLTGRRRHSEQIPRNGAGKHVQQTKPVSSSKKDVVPAWPMEWSGRNRAGFTWILKQGDAAQALTSIDDKSVDCVITSPPYFWLRNYGIEGQLGLETTVGDYVNSINRVMTGVFRVLKADGLLFLNLGDTYYSGKGESQGQDSKSSKRRFGLRAVDKSGGLGINLQRKSAIGIPWRVAEKMCTSGWVLRSSVIWHREKCLPEAVKDRPRRSYEFVFMFAKGRHYYFDREPLIAKNVDEDVWTIPARPRVNGALDTAPYPDELVERCIDIGCRPHGIVLDPFAGSGTTLRVALSKQRSAIGIELHPEYCVHIAAQLSRTILHEVPKS